MKTVSITWECARCKFPLKENFACEERAEQNVCPKCQNKIDLDLRDFAFETCRICGCKEFYVQKDFPRTWGCLVMVIAIALVPWTYGISLPVFFLFDWWLYRKVPDMGVCYLCLAEYRGFALPEKVRAYKHVMAEGFEKRREKGLNYSSGKDEPVHDEGGSAAEQ